MNEKDWTFDDDTKQITFVVPIDVYNGTQTIFISPGYEGEAGLRGKVFSAQSERKKGKWIRIGGSEKCSVCGYTIDDEYYLGNFCQNCGAEMNRGDNDADT